MLRRWCIPLAGLALAGGALAASAPATASSHPAGPTIHLIRPAMHGTAPMVSRGRASQAEQSTNWSGYAAGAKTYNKISASWVEPTAHCPGGSQFSSFWVGLDGFNNGTVEQTGSEVDCRSGSPRYFGWYEMFPAFPVNFGDTVRPGDHFSGSVTFNGSGKFTLVLKDTTQGWSHTVHKTLTSAKRSSAEVIAEAPSSSTGVLPLADFGTVKFSNSMVNGSTLGGASPTKIIMVNGSGRAKDSVSALSNGTNFSAKWLHST
ncbi:MAG TPA: G1 family glutamic endopeptidase [Streptosporangiaceae bacterium]|nr:G1 family glutamic endopeptidase [Streptosporangiaceae bacterium]